MRKPDAEVFKLILNENNLRPEETLFIDDSLQHVVGARKLGIQAYHLDIPAGQSIDTLFA
jgi:putative hydrolase of the HAD superfamily